MLYNPPTGSTDPNASYVGKNVAAGQTGSRVPPKAIEGTQRELVAIILEAGVDSPSNDDLKQALKAIRSGRLWTFDDVGTQNAIAIAPLTPHLTFAKGQVIRTFPGFTNTGQATVRSGSGGPNVPLLRADGSPLVAGDYVSGLALDMWNDGLGNWRLAALARGEVQRIVSNPVLWVRTDGADANDGSANTQAGAFRTIAAAAQAAGRIAGANGFVTIRLGIPGTYTAPGSVGQRGSNIVIQGDNSNPALYVIAGAGSSLVPPLTASGCQVSVQGVTLSNTGTISTTAGASVNGSLRFDYTIFQASPGNPNCHFGAFSGGSVTIGQGCVIAASMGGIGIASGGSIELSANPIAIANTPVWSTACFIASVTGTVQCVGATTFTGTGATGPRYAASTNGVITTNGAGANFFPGSAAGSETTGGRYA